jgi:hypothetical protein
MTFQSIYDKYLYFIFFIKIVFIVSTLIIKFKKPSKNSKWLPIFQKWKENTEFVFIISMSILIIILFNPFFNNLQFINRETTILLFVFGIIMIITSDWTTFYNNIIIKKRLYNK